MRKALHPILEAARSRLKLIERDERRCGESDKYKLMELRGERRAWENISSMLTVRLTGLKDKEELR
jgi:hypothetical protein